MQTLGGLTRFALLSAAWLMASGLISPGQARANRAVSIPAGLEATSIATGLSEPTAVAFAPDGRMFIAEKRGVVRVVLPGEAPHSRRLIDISSHTATISDRGLLGIAVDSDFARNGFIYVLYTYDARPSDSFGPKVGRLSRFTVGRGASIIGGERPIVGTSTRGSCPTPGPKLDCIPVDGLSHGIGTVRSARDGTLWLGVGDGVQWDTITPRLARALDPNVMSGKILHVDRAGHGLPDHPFCPSQSDLTFTCTKVYAKGFRNPFRFQLLASGGVVAGDVGSGRFEEVDLVKPGSSYGWPCFEGPEAHPAHVGTEWCGGVEGSSQAGPLFSYPHGDLGAAIILGPAMPGNWPDGLRGKFVFSDYVAQDLFALDLDAPALQAPLVTGLGEIVDIELTPRGRLAMVESPHDPATMGLASGRVWALRPAGPSQRPWPTPTAKVAGRRVSFAANALDADTPASQLTFSWDFGDGHKSNLSRPVHVYRRPGTFTARCTVSDGSEAATGTVTVAPGVPLPVVAIESPAVGQLSAAGSTVRVSGGATLNGRTMSNRNLTWTVALRHNAHTHQWAAFYGAIGSFKTAVDHDSDSSYRVTLRATTDAGATASRSVIVRPRTRRLTLGSNVPGVKIGWGESAWSGVRATAVGYTSIASAPQTLTDASGDQWDLQKWSDGATAASRPFTMPDANTSLIAIYVERETVQDRHVEPDD